MARPRQKVLEFRGYDLPPHFPVTLRGGDQWHISPIKSQRLHFHNCLEIGLCLSDSGHLLFGEDEVDFHAGDVTFIARNVPHTTWSSPGTESLWSYIFLNPLELFSQEVLSEFPHQLDFRNLLSVGHLVLTPSEHPWALPTVQGILQEVQDERAGYRLCVRGMLAAFLGRVLRVYREKREDQEQASQINSLDPQLLSISPALDYIQQHYDLNFPMETLADLCHLSPTHFRRQFQAQMNTNPLSFLHQTRILHSCTLLRSSQSSILDIASQVGYTSLSCFNRWFLQIMGCTPSAWRKTAPEDASFSLVSYNGWSRAETTEELLAQQKQGYP